MKDELPLALVPEEAECAPGEEEGDGEDDDEGFEDPAWIDKFRLCVDCGAALRGVGCGGEEELRLGGAGMSLVYRVQHLMRGRDWRAV